MTQDACSTGRGARPVATFAFAAAGLLAGLTAGAPARAADIDSLQRLDQAEFRALAEDLAAVASYRGLVPAEGLGTTGFDVAASVGFTRLGRRDLWQRAASGADVPSTIAVPTIRVVKGLPGNVDVGLSYARFTDVDANVFGAEVRWAFLPGNVVLPAVAVRGAVSRLSGLDQLGLRTGALDVSISKGFLNLTPYAGVGRLWTRASPDGVPGLAAESFSQGRVFAGLNVNLGLNLAFEVDRTGGLTTYGVKAGIRF